MKSFIVGTIATAIAFYVLVEFLPGFITYKGELVGLLAIAAIFGLINGFLGPIVKLLALPLSLMTLGTVGFIINGGLLLATAFVADQAGFDLSVGDFPPKLTADTFVAAIVGAAGLSIVSSAVGMVVHD